jgi:hypothetical protein
MGIMADIFITNHEKALVLEDTSDLPASDVAHYGRMTELEMGFIKQALTGQALDFDPDLGFEAINVVDEGERITTKFPDDMLPMLSSMDEKQMEKVSIILANTEELQCQPDDLMAVLLDLKRLSAAALERGLGMYLWNCV